MSVFRELFVRIRMAFRYCIGRVTLIVCTLLDLWKFRLSL